MNTDKMIPIDFSRNITPFVMGDNYYSPLLGRDNCTMYERDVQMFNRGEFDNCGYFVTSFADRPNTGKQPVGDNVEVDCKWNVEPFTESGEAFQFYWQDRDDGEAVVKWKPNHAAMLKQWQAEQPKEEVNFSGNDHHIALQLEALGPTGEQVEFVECFDKPTFTQAQADAGELPMAGVECIINFPNASYRARITYQGNDVGCFIDLANGKEYSFETTSVTFKPIQTAEGKLREVMLLIAKGCDQPHSVVNSFLASDKFTITLKG